MKPASEKTLIPEWGYNYETRLRQEGYVTCSAQHQLLCFTRKSILGVQFNVVIPLRFVAISPELVDYRIPIKTNEGVVDFPYFTPSEDGNRLMPHKATVDILDSASSRRLTGIAKSVCAMCKKARSPLTHLRCRIRDSCRGAAGGKLG
jgi:hypothetical protein